MLIDFLVIVFIVTYFGLSMWSIFALCQGWYNDRKKDI